MKDFLEDYVFVRQFPGPLLPARPGQSSLGTALH
jgi:hypothetical protein